MSLFCISFFDYVRFFVFCPYAASLHYCHSDAAGVSERVCGHFLLAGRVCNSCFLTSGILYLRGATWYLLLKLNWDSENPNFYGSVSWFLIPRSDLVLGNVFGPKGVCLHLTSASSKGLTNLCYLGKRMSKWFQSGTSRSPLALHGGVGEGKKQREAGRDLLALTFSFVMFSPQD